jgi:hypothetical protein
MVGDEGVSVDAAPHLFPGQRPQDTGNPVTAPHFRAEDFGGLGQSTGHCMAEKDTRSCCRITSVVLLALLIGMHRALHGVLFL